MAIFIMELSNAITSFLDYLKFEKRYTEHTVTAYDNDLQQFYLFATKVFSVDQISDIQPVQVRTWMANLKDEGLSSRSINRKLSTLKSFFKFYLRQGIIIISPLSSVSGPRTGKKLPVWFDPSSVEQLLRPELYPDDWEGKTAHLAVTILYETGLRRSELVGLREGQIDAHHHSVRVLGKGRKERILPVRQVLIQNIQAYQICRRELKEAAGHDILLVRANGSPINASWVYQTVKKYASAVTTIEKKSPHVLRHSFATHLTNAGADLNAIKELLGHSSLAATQVYTHNSIEKLKKVHGKAHPKG